MSSQFATISVWATVATEIYSTREWRGVASRAKARDGHRCTVQRLVGGTCTDHLHAHHLIPVAERPDFALDLDNIVTVCSRHHPLLEALRRTLLDVRPWRRCRHRHRTAAARAQCEARLNRRLAA